MSYESCSDSRSMKYDSIRGDDEMKNLLKNFAKERLGKPLDSKLWENEAYMKGRKQYNDQMERLKKILSSSQDGVDLLLELDEIVGEYSGYYGETSYILGFHDGMEIGLEHGKHYERESNLENMGHGCSK